MALDVTFTILVCIVTMFWHIEMLVHDFFPFLFVPLQDIKQGIGFDGKQLFIDYDRGVLQFPWLINKPDFFVLGLLFLYALNSCRA